jgi:hypothetical protein
VIFEPGRLREIRDRFRAAVLLGLDKAGDELFRAHLQPAPAADDRRVEEVIGLAVVVDDSDVRASVTSKTWIVVACGGPIADPCRSSVMLGANSPPKTATVSSLGRWLKTFSCEDQRAIPADDGPRLVAGAHPDLAAARDDLRERQAIVGSPVRPGFHDPIVAGGRGALRVEVDRVPDAAINADDRHAPPAIADLEDELTVKPGELLGRPSLGRAPAAARCRPIVGD